MSVSLPPDSESPPENPPGRDVLIPAKLMRPVVPAARPELRQASAEAAPLVELLDALPLLLWRQDQSGSRRYWSLGGQRWALDESGASSAAGTLWAQDSAGTAGGWLSHVHPLDRALAEQRSLSGQPGDAELRLARPDGSFSWVLERTVALLDAAGKELGLAGVCVDIHTRKLQELDLARRAEHDPLTGLCNRQIFVEHLRRALARNMRRERHLVLIFVDLDGFKGINDAHGHALGDELLIAVSRVLSRLVRPQDVVTRLGGDEFVILIDEVQAPEEGLAIADRLVSELSKPFETSEGPLTISASCGLSIAAPGGQVLADELLERADEAMYLAKRRGKSRSAVYDAEFASKAERRRRLESDLDQALLGGQVVSYFQPIVRLADSRTVGLELLLRWEHPDLGLLCATDFLEAVIRGRRLAEIERRLLPRALEALATWRRNGARDVRLFLNLSAHRLRDPDLVDTLAGLLDPRDLTADALAFEVPESGLTRDFASTQALLERLADLGAGLWIDDFGSGHVSLSRLAQLPISGVKLHRSLALDQQSLGSSPRARGRGLRAALGLTSALDLQAIAQGLETEASVREARALGCTGGQGFYFAPALPEGQVAEWLQRARNPGPLPEQP